MCDNKLHFIKIISVEKNNYLFLMKLHAHCQYGNTVPKQWTHFGEIRKGGLLII